MSGSRGRARRTATPASRALRSVTWQIGVQAGALVLACLVATGAVMLGVYVREANAARDRDLAATVAGVRELDDAPAGVSVAISGPGGTRSSPGMPAGFPDEAALAAVREDGRTRQYVIDSDAAGRSFVVRTARVADREVQVVADQQGAEEDRERLWGALAVAAGVGVVGAALVAMVLARRAVRPMAETMQLQHRFVVDAGHELRTPLTLLSTRAQLLARRLRREDPSGGAADDADAVVADTAVLGEILDDLLVVADPDADRALGRVDVTDVARSAVEAADAHAGERGVLVSVAMRPSGPPDGPAALVEGSSVALQRAVIALVDNAVDHACSAVEVAVEVTGRHVHLRVVDDGPGIPEEVLPRVFERFGSYREQPSGGTASPRRHYGLGLALVSEVASAHGGRITAEPRPDGKPGAVLELRLARSRGAGRTRVRAAGGGPGPRAPRQDGGRG